jgi:flagellar hook protein FlgE
MNCTYELNLSKLTDCAILFNHINACNKWGAIACTDTKGTIRWRHSIDFEGTDPSIASIDNAFNVGSNLFEHWFEEITSVALTQTTAKELIDQIATQSEPEQNEELILDLQSEPTSLSQNEIDEADAVDDSEQDALYDDVALYVTTSRKASISGVQRQFKIGYNRAAVIIEALEKKGIVSAAYDNGSRMVLAPPPL